MIRLRPITLRVLFMAFAVLAGFGALELALPEPLGKAVLLDFEVFHLVSVMIGEGNLRGAYDPAQFLARQSELVGFDGSQLFFSYPPPFAMLVTPLAALPDWAAYLLFMGGSLALYLWALRQLAGQGYHTVLILMLPLMLLILRAGQNGFLTGGLMCLAAFAAIENREGSGIRGGLALGLMAIKPHLAIGFGLWSLLERRWAMVAVSMLTVTGLATLATLAFGFPVWSWFLGSAAASSEALRAGVFPLHRMTSIYAFALSVGLPALTATVLHLGVILSGFAALIWLRRIGASLRVLVGAGLFVSALISPYSYDYDLAMLGGGAALFLEVVLRQASRAERWGLFSGVWALSLYGFLSENLPGTPPSIGGPILVTIGLLLLRLLRREAGLAGGERGFTGRRVRP